MNDITVFLVSLHLPIYDFLQFSTTNKEINKRLNRDDIWYYFLKRDFVDFQMLKSSPKNNYILLHKLTTLSNKEIFKMTYRRYKFWGSIYELYNMKSINIQLSPHLDAYSTLQELNLACNKILSFPKELTELINLSTLNLSNNGLFKLPKEIGNLINLEYLYLQNNRLRKLPKEICKLEKLKNMDLRNNSVTKLPKEFNQKFNQNEYRIEWVRRWN